MEIFNKAVSSSNSINAAPKTNSLHFGSRADSNKYERSPQNDYIDLPKKERGRFFSILGKAITNSLNKKSNQSKINSLNKTCENLINNIEEVQKQFQEIFLRKDITINDALEMIQRYHQIELLGITGSKEEYINALYNEAKNNFGFEKLPISITTKTGTIRNNPNTLGFTDPLGGIVVRSDTSNAGIFNTIHHELRHVKQNYHAFNYNPEEFVNLSQPNNMTIYQETFEYAYHCKPSKDNIEPEYMEFAEKSFLSKGTYCAATNDETEYISQWCERDAFATGNKMEKLFKY